MENNVTGNTVDEVVEEFYEYLLQTKYCTLIEYDSSKCLKLGHEHPDMFTCRIQSTSANTNESFFICGNTTSSENDEMVLEKHDTAVNFDRIFIFKADESDSMKSCLRVLINSWVENALADGGYYSKGQTKEDEIKLILHSMILYNESDKWFSWYGKPENATARYKKEWFSCREGFSMNTPSCYDVFDDCFN